MLHVFDIHLDDHNDSIYSNLCERVCVCVCVCVLTAHSFSILLLFLYSIQIQYVGLNCCWVTGHHFPFCLNTIEKEKKNKKKTLE